MRSELGQRYGPEPGAAAAPILFVGMTRPGFRSLMDPHEDIALLIFSPTELEVYGEKAQFRIPRASITGVKLKPNTHSWIGLGGWIVIECGEQTFFVESRQSDVLVDNKLKRKRLAAQVEKWRVTGEIS